MLRVTVANEQAAPMALPLISLDRVDVHLGGRHVLHDVSWQLRAGEQWAIVGANGSGKSTLLRVIRGDQWPDAGGTRTYALGGTPQPVRVAAAAIGYVSPELQERYVRLQLAVRGWGVIASGLHDTTYVHGTPAPDDLAKIERIVDHLGVRALADRPVGELSFGQLRMLLIARALVPAPRVLVLDECTNGLDRRARGELLAFLARVAEDTHVVAASHRYGDLPATTTSHAIVADGRIVETGAGRPHHAPRARRSAAERPHANPTPVDENDVLIAIRGADVYRGETRVLHGVDWTIRRGEHTAIRGPNGAGKSTFAGLLTGAVPAAHGAEIVRFGESGPFDVRALKTRIVHVSDELQLAYDVDPTVEQVVASGFTASIGMIERPDDDARAVVSEVVARLRLQTLSGRRFSTLSFGERRKVLIARGLVRRPDVLILDEIWSGLDAAFRMQLDVLLDELLAHGTTLVAISHHDDDLPSYLRRAYVIEDGRLTASSSPA